ncbi:MAG: hypothetical protein QG575_711, partial [Euryarchaeota archaeon]|nr:hypothetical protein [Euryarchaeota archaeon]
MKSERARRYRDKLNLIDFAEEVAAWLERVLSPK